MVRLLLLCTEATSITRVPTNCALHTYSIYSIRFRSDQQYFRTISFIFVDCCCCCCSALFLSAMSMVVEFIIFLTLCSPFQHKNMYLPRRLLYSNWLGVVIVLCFIHSGSVMCFPPFIEAFVILCFPHHFLMSVRSCYSSILLLWFRLLGWKCLHSQSTKIACEMNLKN